MINYDSLNKIFKKSSLSLLSFLVLSYQYFRKVQFMSIKDWRILVDVSIIHFYSLLCSCGRYVDSLHHKQILDSCLHSNHMYLLFLFPSALINSSHSLGHSSFQVVACQDFFRAGVIVYDSLKSLELNISILPWLLQHLLLRICSSSFRDLIRNTFCIQFHIF